MSSPPQVSRRWPASWALIRPAELTAAGVAAATPGLPAPWWLHTDLDVLATSELAAVDYPQPGGLT